MNRRTGHPAGSINIDKGGAGLHLEINRQRLDDIRQLILNSEGRRNRLRQQCGDQIAIQDLPVVGFVGVSDKEVLDEIDDRDELGIGKRILNTDILLEIQIDIQIDDGAALMIQAIVRNLKGESFREVDTGPIRRTSNLTLAREINQRRSRSDPNVKRQRINKLIQLILNAERRRNRFGQQLVHQIAIEYLPKSVSFG